jgi:tetratricopeptide (TPR) repeat protein
MPATETEGEDAVFLRATPIARKRMNLLWLDPPRLAQLERPLAQHRVITIVLGDSPAQQREHEITQEDFQWAKQVESIVDMGHAAGQGGDYGEAIRHYREALRMAPGCDLFLMSIGVCYAQLGDHARGLRYLERAAEISPDSDRIRDNLEAVRGMA